MEDEQGACRSSTEDFWAVFVLLEKDEETAESRLKHLLTGEIVTLPKLAAGDNYDLVEEDSSLVLYTAKAGRQGNVKERFLSEIQYVKGSVREVTATATGLLAPDRFPVSAQYVGLRCRGETFKLKVYRVMWSWPHVWWEARLLGAPWGVSDLQLFFRTLTNTHMSNWLKWTCPFFLSLSSVRYCSKGRSVTFLDCLPENGISTAALLVVTVVKCSTGRPRDTRPVLYGFLRDFLDEFLGTECIELEVEWPACLRYQMGSVPSKASTTICIDEGAVHMASVLEKLEDQDLKRFVAAGKAQDPACDLKSGSMHVAAFLSSAWETLPTEVSRQIFGQLALHIDCILADKTVTNPLDISESKSSIPAAVGEM